MTAPLLLAIVGAFVALIVVAAVAYQAGVRHERARRIDAFDQSYKHVVLRLETLSDAAWACIYSFHSDWPPALGPARGLATLMDVLNRLDCPPPENALLEPAAQDRETPRGRRGLQGLE